MRPAPRLHSQRKATRGLIGYAAFMVSRWILAVLVIVVTGLEVGCTRPGEERPRRGDEIVVCGRYFHTGAPVVLWTDPSGYDAYRIEKRFVPWERAQWTPPEPGKGGASGPSTPNRYSIRFGAKRGTPESPFTDNEFERIRGGGWDLATLQKCVDQFVLHYDVCGTSRQCFRVLHDVRGLSVHFMLDVDGTIYQTLDLKERAWHATTSNDRSIGIEIANMGAYGRGERDPLARWYEPDPPAWTDDVAQDGFFARIVPPPEIADGGVRDWRRVGAVPLKIGTIQGRELRQFDFTPQQYDSLIRLTAALCRIFPELRCDYPRDAEGRLVTEKLPDDQLANYRGLIGHYHIQQNKADPGPAMDWDRVVDGARRLR